jgi:hypothetical protein
LPAQRGGELQARVGGRGPDRYASAIEVASRDGLRVWLEADIASRWLEGPEAFREGVDRLGALARLPGVVGIKIADELGYKDGFDDDPEKVMAFLRDSATALRLVAPGRSLLVDMLVPELGCAPSLSKVAVQSARCEAEARAMYPALTVEQVDSYLGSGFIDVVDLSTGLLSESTYHSWGIDPTEAQHAAWGEVHRRGWFGDVILQSRKALAHPGPYPYDSERAESDLRLYVDTPVRVGARAVDIWTWLQRYDGEVVGLMNSGLRSNSLWQGLQERRDRGVRLFTHFTPSVVALSVPGDLRVLAQVFSDVFMAAGIG